MADIRNKWGSWNVPTRAQIMAEPIERPMASHHEMVCARLEEAERLLLWASKNLHYYNLPEIAKPVDGFLKGDDGVDSAG